MDRRRFLRTASAATTGLSVAAVWPGWLSRAFGEDAKQNARKSREEQVREAYARARRDSRPLLLLLIPINTDKLHERGTILGEFINHSGTRGLDDLLSCERVCATVPDAQKALPGLKVGGDPLMLLIEPQKQGVAPRALAIDPDIAPTPENTTRADGSRGAVEDAIENRIGKIADALHRALFPDKESLANRARANHAALSQADLTALKNGVAGEKVEPALVERGALHLRHAAALAKEEATGKRIAELLAAAGKAQVLAVRPAGAKWAKSCGCGTTIEGEVQNFGIACGMGYVPELSQRFLWFYTR